MKLSFLADGRGHQDGILCDDTDLPAQPVGISDLLARQGKGISGGVYVGGNGYGIDREVRLNFLQSHPIDPILRNFSKLHHGISLTNDTSTCVISKVSYKFY